MVVGASHGNIMLGRKHSKGRVCGSCAYIHTHKGGSIVQLRQWLTQWLVDSFSQGLLFGHFLTPIPPCPCNGFKDKFQPNQCWGFPWAFSGAVGPFLLLTASSCFFWASNYILPIQCFFAFSVCLSKFVSLFCLLMVSLPFSLCWVFYHFHITGG